MSTPLATADDLQLFLEVTTINTSRANLVLQLAQDLCETIKLPLPANAKAVVLAVAARAYDNPTAADDRKIGDYLVRSPGGLYLTRADKATIRRAAGGGGAFSIDPTPTGTSCVQTITGTVTGGTFRLNFAGAWTAPIAYNASTAAVQSALGLLALVGVGNVTVTGSAGAWVVEFVNDLATTPVPLLVVDATSLTGSLVVAMTTPGVYGPGQNLAPWDRSYPNVSPYGPTC